jgi:NitT/TauT family transport system permease protein
VKGRPQALSLRDGVAVGAIALAVGVLWQKLGDSYSSVRLLVSTPARAAAHMVEHGSERVASLLVTAYESVLGLTFATAIALLLFGMFVFWPRLAPLVYPWLVASQVIPLIALAPLMILLLGTGPSGKVDPH